MRLAGAGASAPNLHGDDARRELSEVGRFSDILHLFACIFSQPLSRTILPLAACLQGCARARIVRELNTDFDGDARAGKD